MPVVRTLSKGQIVIPEIRKKLVIESGRKLLLQVVGEHAEIVPLPDDPVKSMRGMLKADVSLAEELLRERRKDGEIDLMPSSVSNRKHREKGYGKKLICPVRSCHLLRSSI